MVNKKHLLWTRWTIANALSEFLGLSATFAIIGLLVSRIDTQKITGILLAFAITVLSGAVEATLVGLAQWWAMHPWFPTIKRITWWQATLIGALLGYVLGYLPSTLMSMGEATTQAPQIEPPQWLTLLLAAVLGAVAGAVLSFAQWLVLRKSVKGSGIWIPANMLAWAAGMPVIFLGIDIAFKMAESWQSVLVVWAGLLVTGTIVGAIHGIFLVKLSQKSG